MGFRDAWNALAGRGDTGGGRRVEWIAPTFRSMVLGLTPEELYRTQPHLRTVLSFVARNVAHLGLKTYGRTGENDRERLRADPLALLMKYPNTSMTSFELIETLVSDLGLYDRAYWLIGEDASRPSGWAVRPIPPAWVIEHKGGNAFEPAVYVFQPPGSAKRLEVSAKNILDFHGWNPGRPKHGTSPVETLKQVLAEQVQAWSYREQVWSRGGRVGAYLTRPKDSNWSDAARERFAKDWKDRWTGRDGKKAGGTPILEDGMELKRLGFSAREDEWVEAARLALETVAGVYHVNPTMVGGNASATFSNVKEFRKMLYSETLGPTLARIEDRINTFLAPIVSARGDAYVEFNLEEKLQGDFEEQAAVMSTSTGGPWMTRNEARALRNLPAIDGGDEIITPLNVIIGGQASPRDGGQATGTRAKGLDLLLELGDTHPDEAGKALRALVGAKDKPRIRAKAQATDGDLNRAERELREFFRSQEASVLSRINAKDPAWWDEKRWNDELSAVLLALALTTTKNVATRALAAAGLDPTLYGVSQTEAFLAEVAKSRAGAINSTTRDQVQAIASGNGPGGTRDPKHAFDVIRESRGGLVAQTLITTYAAFATAEAAKQTGGDSKTWIVTSSDPRAEHAAMNGETVGIDAKFSNGAKWPGDPVLGADGVSNCRCDVEVTFG